MITVLIGPPGAGKGTQADLLVEKLGYWKFSTGDALRRHIKNGTEIGKVVEAVMNRGELVSDDVLLRVLEAELSDHQESKVLLDGYPRNVEQAKTLEKLSEKYPVDAVVHLDVSRKALMERLSGRRVCGECGASYHLSANAPKVEGVCDRCGGKLLQREDDGEEKIAVRLDVYDSSTLPVLDYYKSKGLCSSIDGDGATEVVFSRLEDALN